mmetsp:Transcript_8719/g.26090  ORF Transcript_8719/g.26090 Transcript_8719/m.26090 type:complete len:354 (-) Transcript_8719:1359-2420(-)|eukprot:CAMPEP_0113533492 /NCGR_PEP_ID=MMETSP0015_2-20120614/4637_1 /TAXON_ID=2838 /ORGANISM="Odontella" /LENGTH=353 /DNA_ID=CAMNT_0000432555 /DNA_START=206 /DNA_END=1267 /DNA_ORIENTATION=- /assembly_acc=CAM_ASM_000160
MNPYHPLVVEPPTEQQTATTDAAITSPICDFNALSDGIESDTVARKKLKDWGFDPYDVSKSCIEWHSSHLYQASNIMYGARESRPMIIFAHLGDLPMMRYILKNSSKHGDDNDNDPADDEVCKTDKYGIFPLYAAISKPHCEEHVLAMCRWLFANGCDVRQLVGQEWSALSRACLFGYPAVARWLLLNGALLDESGCFDVSIAKRDMPAFCDQCCDWHPRTERIYRTIFTGAHRVISVRDNFFMFLSGTLQPSIGDSRRAIVRRMVTCECYSESEATLLLRDLPDDTLDEFSERTSSFPLAALSGLPGVLEHIGEYVGFETSKGVLTTARGLIEHEKWWNLRQPFFLLIERGP